MTKQSISRKFRGFSIGAIAMVGAVACSTHVPTSYESELAKPNFVDQCVKAGSPKSFCVCVWQEIVDTVPWDEYTKYDKAQAEAKNSDDIPELPKGIKAATNTCAKRVNDAADPTTTTSEKSSESDDTTTTGGELDATTTTEASGSTTTAN